MASILADRTDARQRLLNELPSAPMAKAGSRKLNSDFQAEIGQCVARARLLVGWSKKELAAQVNKDEAQISRWEAGKERPQMDALWSVAEMRGPLVIALAELSGRFDVTTVMTERKSA